MSINETVQAKIVELLCKTTKQELPDIENVAEMDARNWMGGLQRMGFDQWIVYTNDQMHKAGCQNSICREGFNGMYVDIGENEKKYKCSKRFLILQDSRTPILGATVSPLGDSYLEFHSIYLAEKCR